MARSQCVIPPNLLKFNRKYDIYVELTSAFFLSIISSGNVVREQPLVPMGGVSLDERRALLCLVDVWHGPAVRC